MNRHGETRRQRLPHDAGQIRLDENDRSDVTIAEIRGQRHESGTDEKTPQLPILEM